MEEHLALLIGLEFGDVGLSLCGQHEHFGTFRRYSFAHLLHIVVAGGGAAFVNVANVEHRFRGEEEEALGGFHFLLRFKLHGACRFALKQGFLEGHEHFIFHFGVFVATHFSNFFYALDAVFNGFEVLELEFGVDDFLVANGVDRTVNVHHVAVVEAAEHMDDGISFADVAQELVAEAFALRGTLHESGDVNDFHRCRHDASRMHQFGQFGKTFVGHRDDTHVGLDGAEREIGRLRFGVAQTIEEGGLAHVGESNYTTL